MGLPIAPADRSPQVWETEILLMRSKWDVVVSELQRDVLKLSLTFGSTGASRDKNNNQSATENRNRNNLSENLVVFIDSLNNIHTLDVVISLSEMQSKEQ